MLECGSNQFLNIMADYIFYLLCKRHPVVLFMNYSQYEDSISNLKISKIQNFVSFILIGTNYN